MERDRCVPVGSGFDASLTPWGSGVVACALRSGGRGRRRANPKGEADEGGMGEGQIGVWAAALRGAGVTR